MSDVNVRLSVRATGLPEPNDGDADIEGKCVIAVVDHGSGCSSAVVGKTSFFNMVAMLTKAAEEVRSVLAESLGDAAADAMVRAAAEAAIAEGSER